MTDQERLDDIHARVNAWNDRVAAEGTSFVEAVKHQEFANLIEELMDLETDDLMVLIGKSIQEAGEMPAWLTELPDSDI